jgi:hypothetical protein
MNHILHNVSLIILFVGIIMMTIYITKATSNNYMTTERKLQMRQQLRRKQPVREIYDYKISKEYEKMFSQPSIWSGYQDFDPEYKTEKLYIKN